MQWKGERRCRLPPRLSLANPEDEVVATAAATARVIAFTG
jgi:hypothetical protein